MEEGLHVDQERVLTVGDQVLVVQVGPVQGVQEGEQRALPPVELPHLGLGPAGQHLHELDPAVGPPVEHGKRAQPGRAGEAAEPVGEVVEVAVRGDRTGFVHQPRTVREAQQRNRPAAAVAVPRPGLDVDEQASVRPAREPRLRQGRLVGGESVQQFGEGVGRVEADPAEQAGENRMGRQQGGKALPLAHPPQELPEPGPAVATGESARLSCPVQFGHEDTGGDPGQSRPDRPDQSGTDGCEVDEPSLLAP